MEDYENEMKSDFADIFGKDKLINLLPDDEIGIVNSNNILTTEGGESKNNIITIPDHLEILCEMYSGPLAHIKMSNVTGLASSDSAWFFGTEGTLFIDLENLNVFLGKRGDSKLEPVSIPKDEVGGWRVEEEFINAIRGNEIITHTSFEDGVRYMEFTDAVQLSSQSGKKIKLPF